MAKINAEQRTSVIALVGEKGLALVEKIGTALGTGKTAAETVGKLAADLRSSIKTKDGKSRDYSGATKAYKDSIDVAITLAYGKIEGDERKKVLNAINYQANKVLYARGDKAPPAPPTPQTPAERLASAASTATVEKANKKGVPVIPMADAIRTAIDLCSAVRSRIEAGETFEAGEVRSVCETLQNEAEALFAEATIGPREVVAEVKDEDEDEDEDEAEVA